MSGAAAAAAGAAVSEPIQSENMKDTYSTHAFFIRNRPGTRTVISDSKGEAGSWRARPQAETVWGVGGVLGEH